MNQIGMYNVKFHLPKSIKNNAIKEKVITSSKEPLTVLEKSSLKSSQEPHIFSVTAHITTHRDCNFLYVLIDLKLSEGRTVTHLDLYFLYVSHCPGSSDHNK